jgi:hypothetical protein
MKKLCFLIALMYGAPMLTGCSTMHNDSSAWVIKPFESIHHATNRPDSYYHLGRYYQAQNRLEQAADAYRKALAIDPNYADAHNGLGTIYAAEGNYKHALSEFNTAAAIEPAAARIYNNLGFLNLMQGNYAEAVTNLTKATSLDPSNQLAQINLKVALAKRGGTTKSDQVVAQSRDDVPATPLIPDHDSIQPATNKEASLTAPAAAPNSVQADMTTEVADKPNTSGADLQPPNSTGPDILTPQSELAQAASKPHFVELQKPNPGAMPEVLVASNKPGIAMVKLPEVKITTVAVGSTALTTPKSDPVASPASSAVKSSERAQATSKPHFVEIQQPNPEAMPEVLVASNKPSISTVKLPEVKITTVAVGSTALTTPRSASVASPAHSAVKSAAALQTKPRLVQRIASIEFANASKAAMTGKTVALAKTSKAASSQHSRSDKRKFVFEVSNGNGTRKLAARMDSYLVRSGFKRARYLSNHKPFTVPYTTIKFRKGYLYDAARLSRHLREIHELAFISESKNLPAHSDIVLVLGKDLKGKTMQAIRNHKAAMVAMR